MGITSEYENDTSRSRLDAIKVVGERPRTSEVTFRRRS